MAEKVTCIVKGAPKYSDCRCITQIRTDAARYTREEAHDHVKAQPNSIYVEGGGARAYLIAAIRDGVKYVRTRPDDTTEDNLLTVREC
jgi:hypothetical protein